MPPEPQTANPILSESQIADLKLAASKMSGSTRRAFQADMSRKYCAGNARQTERCFGWGREGVQLGLEEQRNGMVCVGAQAAYCGQKRWEETQPEAAAALLALAEAHSQQDPTFRSSIAYTRLTAAEAIRQLQAMGFSGGQVPAPSTMARILNRNGYRLRKVEKAKPQKKIPETDAIFANIQANDGQFADGAVKRLSMDCKATVNIGDYSRGGKTRGDNKAADHEMGCKEKYIPFGVLDEDSGQVYLTFGSSSKTSDFIVDSLCRVWEQMPSADKDACQCIQIKADNGPESSGIRTQFLKRMVEFANHTGKTVHLLYYPPYHSKYNPIERCWGILEQHWNGTQLKDAETLLEWAKTMTWKGINPMVEFSRKVYEKGVTLSKKAMEAVEARLERNAALPKWDILIRPVFG
ncbi:Rhodopirellula transposase family protein [Thiothrix nivea DSM 5205]|uniref:Rhodopirellula transposase family protein n=1 Tax=Thiothrix nivea (strain ATCC 35100 / DSM 5205 / JP2) TaxID=870187 RepID=A0A656HP83_THINJ|nr:Rhodopirellula transposase family protein [Thiothrix nivea DSM 5205]